MSSAGEFEGKEISNNLVSDLGPLLTLFGDQFIIQFLSMSVGWADALLLAMCPFGMLTTAVSAIRVGGGRRLRSIVGRAQETQAIVEQELLVSTSSEVFELWDGQKVRRVIGEAKGLTVYAISHDGTVRTLYEAFGKELVTESAKSGNSVEAPRDSEENLLPGSYSSNPPNLTLNTRAGVASRLELWALAAFGVFLQLCALALPGAANYFLKWSKGEVPVAAYGYPCYVGGTVCLTTGMFLCGLIIINGTEEYHFVLTEEAQKQGVRIICFQEALSIGDQDFPSCAIQLARGDGIFRIVSRDHYPRRYAWLRAFASALITLFGYLVQFAGLRALHYSSTIFQLVVTVIMMGIRAIARRSLTLDPSSTLDSRASSLQAHTIARLSLLFRIEGGKTHIAPNPWNWLRQRIGLPEIREDENADFNKNPLFWELISAHSAESSQPSPSFGTHANCDSGDISSKLLQRARGPFTASLRLLVGGPDRPAELTNDAAISLRTYAKIASCITESNNVAERNASQKASSALCDVIEKVMCLFCASEGVSWRPEYEEYFVSKAADEPLRIIWEFNIREARVSEYHGQLATRKRLRVILQREPHDDSWRFDQSNRELLHAAISLSLYTDAARQAYATPQARTAMANTSRDAKFSRRIVGHARLNEAALKYDKIQEWLRVPVGISNMGMKEDESSLQQQTNSQSTPMNIRGVPVSLFGMFLSSSADQSEDSEDGQFQELMIDEDSKAITAFQYAQELFSLFILAVASELDLVKGTTEIKSRGDRENRSCAIPGRLLENSLFQSIAKIAFEEGLAESMSKAAVLIIPAFAKYNLLPFPDFTQNTVHERDGLSARVDKK